VLRRLSGEPGPSLTERLLHHGARVALLIAVALVVTLLFPPTSQTTARRYEYDVGTPAPEDVIAEVPFSVPKTPQELDRDRELAMGLVPPTLDAVTSASDTTASRLRAFFDALDGAVASGAAAGLAATLEESSITASPSQVAAMLEESTRNTLRRAALSASTQILPRGVLDARLAEGRTSATVTLRTGEVERSLPADQLLTSREFFDRAIELLPDGAPPDVRDLLRLVLLRFVEFSLVPNRELTDLDRDAAARSVVPTKASVLQGQAIVRRGAVISPEEAQWLDAYEAELARRGLLEASRVSMVPFAGATLLHFMLFAIFGLAVYFTRRDIYGNFRWLLLIALLGVAYFAAAAGVVATGAEGEPTRAELLPIAFVALPVAVLWDARTSLVLVLVLAALTGTLPPFTDFGAVLVVMGGGAAAAMSARALRRRSETWVAIALIAGSAGLILLGHGLATAHELSDVARGAALAVGNATVSALLAMGFLWVFELFTGITTDQTLLEWGDPTRPLLRRLALEAPGTYAHTLGVANLSEAAATTIGANSLLCRVGVYYHDVGKMLRPHYFVENQPEGRNPHDKLKPETSAEIVREHVTEGARLARDAKVPNVIVDFILEHHGTQRIGYFYERALEETEGEVDAERFSYPGPRPRSRETAIVMLADSCESAGRAMQEPTSERLRELIDTIVEGKISDGQLDDAPLTLREIKQVKEQFVTILTGVTHRRIEYPQTKHITDAAIGEEQDAGAAAPAVPLAGSESSGS
jgi:putative nucleotidyltransferase with HDIG domain